MRSPRRMWVRIKPARGGKIVYWMEVAGYLFLAVLATFVIYSYFKRLPILAAATGTAVPTMVQVKARADTAVLSVLAKHGQHVKKGQPVLEATDDTVEVGLVRIREALRDRSAARSRGQADGARLGRLTEIPQSLLKITHQRPLVAPKEGWVIFPGGRRPAGYAAKDTRLFSIAHFHSLTITANIPKEQQAKRLRVGQLAKVWCRELTKDPLPGKVVRLVPGGADLPEGQVTTIIAPLTVLPPRTREQARRDFFSGKMEKKWRPSVAITVGTQRLLNQIRTPKT